MAVNAKNGDIWGGSQSTKSAYLFASPYTAATVAEPVTLDPVNTLAIDASGNTWATLQPSGAVNGKIVKFANGSPSTPTVIDSPAAVAGCTTQGLDAPRGLAIDGVGRLFVNSFSVLAGVVEFDPLLGTAPGSYLVNPCNNGFNPTFATNTATTPATNTQELVTSAIRSVTIDQAGAMWISNGSAAANVFPAVQILGVAAPTNPVLAAGQYGVKP